MQSEITELRNQVRTLTRIVCLVCCLFVVFMFAGCSGGQQKKSTMQYNLMTGEWERVPTNRQLDSPHLIKQGPSEDPLGRDRPDPPVGNGAPNVPPPGWDRPRPNASLFHLCGSSDSTVSQVQKCLKQGADVNAKDKEGCSPLIRVTLNNQNPEIMSALLQAGADVNARSKVGGSALFYTVIANQERNESPNADAISVLLQAGADVNAKGNPFWGASALQMAVKSHATPEVVLMLLQAGADVNATDQRGMSPLCEAAGKCNLEVISLLLQAGADVNNPKNRAGLTPLMGATANDNPEVISLLLQAGADVNVKNFMGKTVLDIAQDNEKLNGTKALKELEEASKP